MTRDADVVIREWHVDRCPGQKLPAVPVAGRKRRWACALCGHVGVVWSTGRLSVHKPARPRGGVIPEVLTGASEQTLGEMRDNWTPRQLLERHNELIMEQLFRENP